jgi:CHAD domain-containing protein
VGSPYREREDKFDVDPDWALPDLAGVLPVDTVTDHRTLWLSSQYFDTTERHLLHHGVTLRLRTGDADVGWQLKIPDDGARTELYARDGRNPSAVPAQLREIVFGISAGASLHAIATIDTARTSTRIRDAGGDVLAEIDDDRVTAVGNGADVAVSTWREVEVELGTGDERLLATIGTRLMASGARPAASPSKLSRALGEPSRTDIRRPARTLGDLITNYLGAQYAALIAGDLALRRSEDVVHRTRVATRRYRSVLRVFADLFDRESARVLGTELAWYAELLGRVRDAHVLGEHIAQTIAEVPAEVDTSAAAQQLDTQLADMHEGARQALLAQMHSTRYLALLALLHDWQQRAPMIDAATTAPAAVGGFLDQSSRILAKRLKRARRPQATAEMLHRARKAGKRARYTAELAEPALGKRARRVAKRATRLQDVLGEHQDSISAATLLNTLSVHIDQPRVAFVYGVVFGGEQLRGQRARERPGALGWP